MSSNMFVQPNSSTVETRRSQTTNIETRGSAAAAATTNSNENRRSLSGKFRNLFRRNSPSPKRRFHTEIDQSPPKTTIETPQLRTPTIPWPFGRKNRNQTTSPTNKTKNLKKSKNKNPPPPPSSTMTTTMNYVERPSSIQSYDSTAMKGFRDYMVIDQGTSTIPLTNEMSVDLPFVSSNDRSRSSSISHIEQNPTMTQLLVSKVPLNQIDLNSTRSSSSSSSSLAVPIEKPKSRNPSIVAETHSGKTDLPWLTSIVEHHLRTFRPGHLVVSSPSPPLTPTTISNIARPIPRFEASTSTDDSFSRHDGYIRPLTPEEKAESPVIYRSSAVIYTRDKHRYVEGGEILTWSIQQQQEQQKADRISSIRNAYDYPPNVRLDGEPKKTSMKKLSSNFVFVEKHSNLFDSTTTNEQFESENGNFTVYF